MIFSATESYPLSLCGGRGWQMQRQHTCRRCDGRSEATVAGPEPLETDISETTAGDWHMCCTVNTLALWSFSGRLAEHKLLSIVTSASRTLSVSVMQLSKDGPNADQGWSEEASATGAPDEIQARHSVLLEPGCVQKASTALRQGKMLKQRNKRRRPWKRRAVVVISRCIAAARCQLRELFRVTALRSPCSLPRETAEWCNVYGAGSADALDATCRGVISLEAARCQSASARVPTVGSCTGTAQAARCGDGMALRLDIVKAGGSILG